MKNAQGSFGQIQELKTDVLVDEMATYFTKAVEVNRDDHDQPVKSVIVQYDRKGPHFGVDEDEDDARTIIEAIGRLLKDENESEDDDPN